MSSIDWSAASVKELMENGTVKDVMGKAAEKIKAEAAKPVTLNLGYVSDDDRSTDGRYRDAILAELARLHRIANVGESLDIDARIDELLSILEDVEGDE